jgi:glucokinase
MTPKRREAHFQTVRRLVSRVDRIRAELPMDDTGNGILLADVGGTNVRFAVLRGTDLGPVTYLEVADHASFADAMAAYLGGANGTVSGAVLAVAGVVTNERCALTNNDWIVDAAELRARFGLTTVHLVNDFEAIAWSLPQLAASDLKQIGGTRPMVGAPMAVLGPGTGLGVAACVPHPGGDFIIHSEGGHATAPAGNAREAAVLDALRAEFAHVSVERLLSGPGLENLYRALVAIDHAQPAERCAADIVKAARDATCPASRAALDMFCAMLGDIAGNLALTFGAKGGVYLAGGVIAHLGGEIDHSAFRARFEAKGRMRGYVAPIPVYLIVHSDPAFVGLRALALSSASRRESMAN